MRNLNDIFIKTGIVSVVPISVSLEGCTTRAEVAVRPGRMITLSGEKIAVSISSERFVLSETKEMKFIFD
jgi:hypothetical protein